MAAQSGAVGKNAATWMEATVTGPGLFRFQWKVDCERDDSGDATWDHLAVSVDGAEARRIDGSTGWSAISLDVAGEGAHAIRWTFSKDGFDAEESAPADLAWVSGVLWIPTVEGDPIPAVTDDSEVAAALEGSADGRLAGLITTAEEYNDYRIWVVEKGLDPQAVRDSQHAWVSFVLGTGALFANEPVIQLGTGEAGLGGGGRRDAGGTTFHVRVAVRDGDTLAAVDPAKVADMFEVTSDPVNWNGEAKLSTTVEQKGAEGNILLFDVTPGDGLAEHAFLRLSR